MCKKRRIKRQAHCCFCCGNAFRDWQDTHIHRIDFNKTYNYNNCVVLCAICKQKYLIEKIEIWNIKLDKMALDYYFLPFGHKYKYNFVLKLRQMRDKYNEKQDRQNYYPLDSRD